MHTHINQTAWFSPLCFGPARSSRKISTCPVNSSAEVGLGAGLIERRSVSLLRL